MENGRKHKNLCQLTRREGELTNSVMTLVGQETDFQEKFELGLIKLQGKQPHKS